MQTLAYAFDGITLHQVIKREEQLTCQPVSSAIKSGAAVACFSPELFYYIAHQTPNVLCCWGPSVQSSQHALPGPAIGVFVHLCKVYCFGGDSLHVIDPLDSNVETIPLHHKVTYMLPAGHGFVFLDDVDELYAFHFNDGVSKVLPGRKARLLGCHSHWVIALIGVGQIVAVNESGEVRENAINLENAVPFLSLDGAILSFLDDGRISLKNKESNLTTTTHGAQSLRLIPLPLLEQKDVCSICECDFSDGDGVTLDCGHAYHATCLTGWSGFADGFLKKGDHVVFTNAMCPGGCGYLMRHACAPLALYANSLRQMIKKDAVNILRVVPNKTLEDLLYYICHRCGKPFYGGERWCQRMMSGEPPKKPSDLICSNCNDDFLCPRHNHDFVLYKCRYCCNPALHLSFGNRYLCDQCFARWESKEPEPIPCPGAGECPLKGVHEKEGSYPLGCMLCLPPEGVLKSLTFPSKPK